jgi:hypothetical protein
MKDETPRMREIREEIVRLEDDPPCEACRARWAGLAAKIDPLVEEWWALDAELPGGAERAARRAAELAADKARTGADEQTPGSDDNGRTTP